MKNIPLLDSPSPARIVDSLREQVRRIEGQRRVEDDLAVFSSGAPPLDRLLPEGGLLRGQLIEWLGAGQASGAGTLALLAAREASLEGGAVVVMDRRRWFYPPAAAALGIDLESVIVIRAASDKDQLWALDQALRCPGVATVWAPLERLDWRSFRRLQLAAEESGCLGLLLRPAKVRGQPSWSHLQLLVEPRPSTGQRRLRVEVVRGQTAGRAVELEIDDVTSRVREVSKGDETHSLPLAAGLARSAPRRRSAGA
jgi:protein ImuA